MGKKEEVESSLVFQRHAKTLLLILMFCLCLLLRLFSELLDLITSWCPGVQFCHVFKICPFDVSEKK